MRHPDGSRCFCPGRVLRDGRFIPRVMCPTSLERGCVCALPSRDPEACDFHRKRVAVSLGR